MSDSLHIKFWGVRGSYPTPGPRTIRYGGNTPCVEIQAAGKTLVFDAGTGIIELGQDLMRRAAGDPIEVALFFSHIHHDHTQGFPFFKPCYMGFNKFYIFGPGVIEPDLEKALSREMLPPVFPIAMEEMAALKFISALRETDVVLLGQDVGGVAVRNRFHEDLAEDLDLVRVHTLRSYAHPNGVLVYRIEWRGRSVVYATDVEGYANADRRLVNFARGADILIHDAQYTDEHYLGQRPNTPATQGWGHSTISMACDVARAADVGQLVLFHHEPQYDDNTLDTLQDYARTLFPNTVTAHEGLELKLTAREALAFSELADEDDDDAQLAA